MIGRGVGIAEVIEDHLYVLEDLVEMVMVPGHQLGGGYTLLFGIDDYGGAVRVRTADKGHIQAHLSQASDVDVRGYVGPEMTYVAGPVGIG